MNAWQRGLETIGGEPLISPSQRIDGDFQLLSPKTARHLSPGDGFL